MIPAFLPETGNPPPGEHPATWEEIVERFGYTPWRRKLLEGLKTALESLRATQKAKYGGELFVADWPADETGALFRTFFQHDRDANPKGIIVIDLKELP